VSFVRFSCAASSKLSAAINLMADLELVFQTLLFCIYSSVNGSRIVTLCSCNRLEYASLFFHTLCPPMINGKVVATVSFPPSISRTALRLFLQQ
jgi:hypothetical protein